VSRRGAERQPNPRVPWTKPRPWLPHCAEFGAGGLATEADRLAATQPCGSEIAWNFSPYYGSLFRRQPSLMSLEHVETR
jgi:hypothetical protein